MKNPAEQKGPCDYAHFMHFCAKNGYEMEIVYFLTELVYIGQYSSVHAIVPE
jgi:hypothetical protein